MKIKSLNIEKIVGCLITLEKEKIPVNKFDLEVHYLAGGDVINISKGLINAKRNNLKLDFKVAAEADLRKMDLIKAIDQWKHNHPDETVIVRL